MTPPALVIVSGGQTGVDRAALDAALAAGADCGGWCPAGRLAEDGEIADRYPLKEHVSPNPEARTRENVRDSSGTLVLLFPGAGPGTLLTIGCARQLGKPLLVLKAGTQPLEVAVDRVLEFVRSSALERLNVAGPRASEAPGAYAYAHELVARVLQQLQLTET